MIIVSIATDANVETLGVDQGYARSWIEAVSERLNTKLVDAIELLLTLRKRKTDWEIDMIRRASELATTDAKAFVDNVTAGQPELTIMSEMQNAYYRTYLGAHSIYDIETANKLMQYGFVKALSAAQLFRGGDLRW